MATPITASRFGGDVKDHVPTTFHGAWATHNRGSRGTGWGPVHGVMLHHYGPYSTVAGAIDYARKGSNSLPGPLYSVLVDRQGTVHLLGWGRVNHAGSGDEAVLQAVIAERYPLPKPRAATTDGNSRFYGVCLLNKGDGKQTYPKVQLDAAAAVAALICRAHTGWTAKSVIGHKEWQPGKPDPTTSMSAFRTRVAGYLSGGIPDLRPKQPAPTEPAPAAPECCTCCK